MIDVTLRSLFDAVQKLSSAESLALLNLDDSVLDDPATTLEYVERYRFWQQLTDIVSSIPDLLTQDHQIALVGFLGHFSSGKSSLINALMGVGDADSPGYRRAVGPHPTDTGITLITHRDRADVVKQSSYTVVKEISVIHGPAIALLEHATLVDTPGLGNQAKEQHILTRFLHLCHVLVMTIDGRRPFADKDKDFDLLDTAFNKLSGVPKLVAITSAEEFLTSRKGDFATDWNEQAANDFWAEALRRLETDPRFAQHMSELDSTPRFFLDSKEGFNVEKLIDALLPIVTDEGHKARIRDAQAHYVLEVAFESLVVLHRYISARSDNLNRLRAEAQNRADNTKTALAEMVRALEGTFAEVRLKLQETRQQIPALDFPIAAIAIVDAISPRHKQVIDRIADKINLRVAAGIRGAGDRVAAAVVSAHYSATRWWRTGDDRTLADSIDVARLVTASIPSEDLITAAVECAADLFDAVNKEERQRRQAGIDHLTSRLERYTIGNRIREITDALHHFENLHDDVVKTFLAYVTQPSSSELLKEHGFVEFDDSGRRAVQAQRLEVDANASVQAIVTAAESCRSSLKALSDDDESDNDLLKTEREEEEELENSALDEALPGVVEGKVADSINGRFTGFLAELESHVKNAGEEDRDTTSKARERVTSIWKARGTLLGRFALVAIGLTTVGVGIQRVWPGSLIGLWEWLPGGTRAGVVISVITTLVVMAVVFVLSGAENPALRTALGSTVRAMIKAHTARRRNTQKLRSYARDAVERLAKNIGNTELALQPIIVSSAIGWFEESSASYEVARQELSRLEGKVRRRAEHLDEFNRLASTHMNILPAELNESADAIRTDAVERHMKRIREATDAVDGLRSDLENLMKLVESAL